MKKKNKEKKVLEPQYYTSRINTSTYNYKVYYMSVPEKIINVLIAFVIGACIGYLFYGGIGKDEYGQATTVTYCLNVIIPVIVGVIAVKLYIPVRIQSIIKKQKNQLNKQFRDMLEALSTSLGAGKNVIDSFRSVYADISEITDGISNGFKTYSKENDNVSQALYNTSDKKMAEKIISEDINSTAASYGLETVSVKCSFTSDMTAVSMINVYVKENNIAGNDNIDRLRTDIAGRYEISVEQIDIREAGESG